MTHRTLPEARAPAASASLAGRDLSERNKGIGADACAEELDLKRVLADRPCLPHQWVKPLVGNAPPSVRIDIEAVVGAGWWRAIDGDAKSDRVRVVLRPHDEVHVAAARMRVGMCLRTLFPPADDGDAPVTLLRSYKNYSDRVLGESEWRGAIVHVQYSRLIVSEIIAILMEHPVF